MFGQQKSSARRIAVREKRPDTSAIWFKELQCNGTFPSIAIAAVFWICATAILMMRQDLLPYRPGQSVQYDIPSRVDFNFADASLKADMQEETRNHSPRVYRSTTDKSTGDIWQALQDQLLSLPDTVGNFTYDQLKGDLRAQLDSAAVTQLQIYQTKPQKAVYEDAVNAYITAIRARNWVILPAGDRAQDMRSGHIMLMPGEIRQNIASTMVYPPDDELKTHIHQMVKGPFRLSLQPRIEAMTLAAVQPTHIYDPDQTAVASNAAAEKLSELAWTITYRKNQPIVHKDAPGRVITMRDWNVLQAENRAFIASLDGTAGWKSKLGISIVTLLLTIALASYTAHFQPRVVTNHARAIAISALLLSMLLLAELAGLGTGPIYLFAVAPTLLVGMILSISYDQRFAVGLASVHAILVTVGLDQRIGFLLIVWVGLVFTCFLLSDIRSRSRLIEVGGVAAIAMMAATAAWGLISMDSWQYIATNSLYAGAAGLSAGFVILGTLPFIEKAFRITTSMTLLELADASHPLLRRLALEAPGTYSHSLQVATLAEAAAESISANSLLCRVSAYYHDVGKINKPDYFVENQQSGQQNRHMNLTPSVSFLIIKGHVMDGVEMAKEYTLPTSLFPFIQQHHGTTLVEYFFHAACTDQKQKGEEPSVSDTEFRYPGPKPKTKEVAILMLSDAAESATRSMKEPTAGRIEALIHDLAMKRLLDGQFDECDLTLRDLSRVEQSLTKTLLSIYHGRLAYPSTAALTVAPAVRLA